jgi:hypothetical protein
METKRLVLYIIAILILGPLFLGPFGAGCVHHPRPAPIGTVNGPSVNVSTNFGGSNVNVMSILCAGKVSLTQGSATVTDSCFTGDTNIVVCSDISSANAVRCEPGKGSLKVEGHSNDAVAYVRAR